MHKDLYKLAQEDFFGKTINPSVYVFKVGCTALDWAFCDLRLFINQMILLSLMVIISHILSFHFKK